jgi:vacuolar-type H+-ATPase subunit E/Vma4
VGAEALLQEVEERRRKALDQLNAEYTAKKTELAERNTEELSSISDSTKRETESLVERERTRISGAAKLQAKKEVFDATETMLENNILALKQALAEYASSKDYPSTLSKMANYAKKRLGEGVGLVCRSSDAAVLKKAGAKIISSDLNCIGGFKAESQDGNLELDLTFEEILRGRDEEARAFILSKE